MSRINLYWLDIGKWNKFTCKVFRGVLRKVEIFCEFFCITKLFRGLRAGIVKARGVLISYGNMRGSFHSIMK